MTTSSEDRKFGKTIITWTAPEYIQHDKDKQWYIIAGITAAVSVIIATLTWNWSMALAIIVFAVVYHYLQTKHPPKNIEIKITELGIYVGEMFFPYSHIQAFWIFYTKDNKSLNLKIKGRVYSDVIIQLNDQDPATLRKFLVGEIPELEGKEEKLMDILIRLFKL
jgi:hypothetical protein